MIAVLIIIALATLGTAAVALALRDLIHSALLLIASWFGIAAFYLWAGAQFVAFAQVLVYVGAVSMVVLFAVLLTRRAREDRVVEPNVRVRVASALITGGAVFGVLAAAILQTPLPVAPGAEPGATVRQLGTQLMGPHAGALLVMGILLTVALLGGVVLASAEPNGRGKPAEDAP
jgi:NADH:ubiquinone oxidoreductase subunit 6 (subunit J)